LTKMAARIQGIARHALSTFMIGETAVFSSNFEKLKTLVSKGIGEFSDSKASLLFWSCCKTVHVVIHVI